MLIVKLPLMAMAFLALSTLSTTVSAGCQAVHPAPSWVIDAFNGGEPKPLEMHNIDQGRAFTYSNGNDIIDFTLFDNYQGKGKQGTLIRATISNAKVVWYKLEFQHGGITYVTSSPDEPLRDPCYLVGLPGSTSVKKMSFIYRN